ncbi:S10 family serine carboxypeptidase-like protein [Caulobacter soli]|uniref:S10 family serine carboxypeptidase-like protein n=1 Tax=Caulobacter soli TaxID=2708539 RepID=UPI001FE2513B|nr:peptidase S10 [Caulobacter soli]
MSIRVLTLIAAFVLGQTGLAQAQAAPASVETSDETPIASTAHRLVLGGKTLQYTARTGRLPIRDPATGAVHGWMYFVAYSRPSKTPRPVTFIWNGGPGANSTLLHFEAFGPRRLDGETLRDNAETLLTDTDLVFVDPIGTGFSRAAQPEYQREFYSTLGDIASVSQFVETYQRRFVAKDAPVFLAGESYGVWRAAGVAEALEKAGRKVAGVMLISGGVPVGQTVPREVTTALYTPSRAAAATVLGKANADPKAVQAWALNVYAPALARRDALEPAERAAVIADLARYTGLQAEQIDPKTLALTNRQYLAALLKPQVLNTFDMRKIGPDADGAARVAVIGGYLRDELGYHTKLPYAGLEPDPADTSKSVGSRWNYDQGDNSPASMAAAMAGEGPPGGAQPWVRRAIALDPKLRVFVAAGLYDSLNSCSANDYLLGHMEPKLAEAFTVRCYAGGHMMYRDTAARMRLSADVIAFIKASR